MAPTWRKKEHHHWLVVSTHLKNISQNGNLPQIGVKIKNIWNHHPDHLQQCRLVRDILVPRRVLYTEPLWVMPLQHDHLSGSQGSPKVQRWIWGWAPPSLETGWDILEKIHGGCYRKEDEDTCNVPNICNFTQIQTCVKPPKKPWLCKRQLSLCNMSPVGMCDLQS